MKLSLIGAFSRVREKAGDEGSDPGLPPPQPSPASGRGSNAFHA